MKLFGLGFCLLCLVLVSMRVFRIVQHVTETNQQVEASLPAPPPKVLPRHASGAGLDLLPGTVVTVTLADPIDTEHDPFGKQYAASVSLIDDQPAAAGSRATVAGVNTNSGWVTQLTGLTVNGRKFQVLSGAGSVIGEQGSHAIPSHGVLEQVGLAHITPPSMNERGLLPSATQLRFVLIGNSTSARAAVESSGHRAAAGRLAEPGPLPAEPIAPSDEEPGISYLCRAIDTPDRTVPISYYIADVFKTSDSQALVERRWHDFLVATYPYRFAGNTHAIAQCSQLKDPAIDLDARQKLERQLKSENAAIVETRWHYTLGPPPSTGVPAAPSPPR